MKVHSNLKGESISTPTFVTPIFSLLKATSLLKSHQAASWAVLAPHFPLFLMLWHLNNGWLFLPCVSNNFKVWIGLHFQHIMMRMLDYLNITDFICNASSHIVHLTQLEQFLMSPCKDSHPPTPQCISEALALQCKLSKEADFFIIVGWKKLWLSLGRCSGFFRIISSFELGQTFQPTSYFSCFPFSDTCCTTTDPVSLEALFVT